ncbi:RpiB/LacA/LacB family sugar-phosphate isomerase, partial [Chloroflexota bacterium]
MRIAIGCDHRGLKLKKFIMGLITEAGRSCQDLGTYTTASVDYPDIAKKVAEAVA